MAAKTAVTSFIRAMICPFLYPDAASQSADMSGGISAPASVSARRQPAMRPRASNQSSGPETCQTVECPASSRCLVAA